MIGLDIDELSATKCNENHKNVSKCTLSFNNDMYILVYNIEIVKIEKFDLAPPSQNGSN